MHIYFIRNSLSTYDYIIQKRAKKLEAEKALSVMESQIGMKNMSYEDTDNSNSRIKSAGVATISDIGMASNGMSKFQRQ